MKTVLLIDDEPDFLEVARRTLEPAGYRFVPAGSAEEGWEKLKGGGIDVALVDRNLPGASGVEFCRRVRGDAAFACLPLTIVTVRNLPEEQAEGLKASGADLYLTKPIDPEELLAHIDSLLKLLER